MNKISLQENFLQVVPDCEANTEVIIKDIFNNNKCDKFDNVHIDLSGFNCFKAIKIAAIISAKGLIKNPNTTYEFLIDNEFTKSQIKILHLSNIAVVK